MQILALLGTYLDAVVVLVTSQKLLFTLALAMLWVECATVCVKSWVILEFVLFRQGGSRME